MKKFFIILLLLVMPLHASWAAVAAYCQHEKEVTTAHFGHHDHQNEHEHAKVNTETDESSEAINLDCFDCHGFYAGIAVRTVDMPADAPANIAPRAILFYLISTSPPRPERPQWFLAA